MVRHFKETARKAETAFKKAYAKKIIKIITDKLWPAIKEK
jgi:hypothetical protein